MCVCVKDRARGRKGEKERERDTERALLPRSPTPPRARSARGAWTGVTALSDSDQGRPDSMRDSDQPGNVSKGDAHAPMYLLRSSGPFTPMNPSPHRPATAPASSVFPHPGGPYSSTPDRTLPAGSVTAPRRIPAGSRPGHGGGSVDNRLLSPRRKEDPAPTNRAATCYRQGQQILHVYDSD